MTHAFERPAAPALPKGATPLPGASAGKAGCTVSRLVEAVAFEPIARKHT